MNGAPGAPESAQPVGPKGGLERYCPPAPSLAERAPSNPYLSGTPPTAGKSVKLLPLCCISVRQAECAYLPEMARVHKRLAYVVI